MYTDRNSRLHLLRSCCSSITVFSVSLHIHTIHTYIHTYIISRRPRSAHFYLFTRHCLHFLISPTSCMRLCHGHGHGHGHGHETFILVAKLSCLHAWGIYSQHTHTHTHTHKKKILSVTYTCRMACIHNSSRLQAKLTRPTNVSE